MTQANPPRAMTHHIKLYSHCHKIFMRKLDEGTLMAPDYIFKMTHQYPMLYCYPDSHDALVEVSGLSLEELQQLGWILPIFNQPFVIWFKDRSDIAQLIPINLQDNGSLQKLNSVNMNIPFALRLMRKQQQQIQTLAIVDSPLQAIMLNDLGVHSVATGSKSLRLAQIHHLAAFNCELIYLNTKKAIDGACDFVFKVDGQNENSICLFDSWDELYEQDDVQQYIWSNRIIGHEFVAERIINKKRRTEGISREHELLLAKQKLAVHHREDFGAYIATKGYTNVNEYALACHFMAELLMSEMSYEEASAITQKRFNLKIVINN